MGEPQQEGWEDYKPSGDGWQDYAPPAPNTGLAPAAGGPASQPMKEEGITVPDAGRIPGRVSSGNEVTNKQALGGLAAGAVVGAAPLAAPAIATGARLGARAGMGFVKAHPIISTIALNEAGKLPGVGKYISKIPSWLPLMLGGKEAAAPEAEAAESELAQGGKPLTETPEALAKVPVSKPEPATGGGLGSLQNLLEKSLGAKKLEPNVSLRNQLETKPTSPAIPTDLTPGHTPLKSSALRSYAYDPQAQEFHAKTTSGNTVYVYGGVSQAEAKNFELADSKGKAWQAIRTNPLVAKIVDGKRIAVKPSGEGLTGRNPATR